MSSIDSKRIEKTEKTFAYNVLGVILPFILATIPIIVLRKYCYIWAFLDEGEFLLFSAGLFTNSIFLFGENKNSITDKQDKILSNNCFWLLIISAAFYAIIYCIKIIASPNLSLNILFIRIASIILFCISVYANFRSILLDYLKFYPNVDVEDKSRKEVDDLLKKL